LKENCRVIVSSLVDAHEEGELLVWLQAMASRCWGEFERRFNNASLRELGRPPAGQALRKCNDRASRQRCWKSQSVTHLGQVATTSL